MILLNQNTENIVVLTLKEKTTLSAPFYLFEFISDDNKETIYFTATDTSINTERFNKFIIELTTDAPDLLNSVLNLPLNGYYSYNIYSQVSATNLDINNITEIVESGKVAVVGTVMPIKNAYDDGQKTKIVYNG